MNSDSPRRAWADINLQALKTNLARVRQCNPNASITTVIKSNAYGHGVDQVAGAFSEPGAGVDRFGVATMEEVVALNKLDTGRSILLLQGFNDADQLRYVIETGIEFVIHADYQLAILKKTLFDQAVPQPLTIWLKFDSGMNRLGLTPAEFRDAYKDLSKLPQVGQIILMSHLACADDPAADKTQQQLCRFNDACAGLEDAAGQQPSRSLAASAAILAWPDAHFEHLRPGIMLYGGSPFGDRTGAELELQPVMTLRSRLMAIKQVAAGESIGYGATFTCEKSTRVGVVSIGYGDGYPRAAPNGTPVLVKTADGYQRTRLIGRVSMDMITIDLESFSDTEVGDEVILWGQGLSADEVARFAGTISYELFCQVTSRVPRHYA